MVFVKEEYDEVLPIASTLIESFRAFGYDLQTAIADLIDNSIAAEAKNIWLHFIWDGENSKILLKDDGRGMSEKKLIEAMRPGSQNPLKERAPKDLGRYGLGLKTASFSQCRRLSVYSKDANSKTNYRCWDLDYIAKTGQWRLLKGECVYNAEIISEINALKTGTIVIWGKLDRLTLRTSATSQKDHEHFVNKIDNVKHHLGMVFHRFLEKPDGLKIFLQGRKIKQWDPFMREHSATQGKPIESLFVDGKKLTVTAYVLPHHSKLKEDNKYEEGAGIRGWTAHQGFYIYRNQRMLVDGSWLGICGLQDEHTKLARIQIDLPNDMDSAWMIDVKKSKATPPPNIKKDLQKIARLVRGDACSIYRHRGKVIARKLAKPDTYVWLEKKRRSKQFYTINREHPLVKNLLENTSEELQGNIRMLLKIIEETIPTPHIIITNSEQPDSMCKPFENLPKKEIQDLLEGIWDVLTKNMGLNSKDALAKISSMEPFDTYPEYIASLVEAKEDK